jgi:hypothetical protein
MGRLGAWGLSLKIVQWTPMGLAITLGDRDMNTHVRCATLYQSCDALRASMEVE